MDLVFLHGAPASGKLTVAKALLEIVDGRLFDNHAVIDVARTVFDFGAPGFWELVRRVRLSVLEAAAAQHVLLVVMTYCYSEPEDRAEFEQIEDVVRLQGGRLRPVFLSCSIDELVRRVGNADRVERRKASSEQGLRDFLAQINVAAVPHTECLKLDSEVHSAEATARAIVRHFGLAPTANS